MDSIKAIIPQIIERLSLHRPETRQDVQGAWRRVVAEAARHSAVVDFKDGRLKVHVDSPARMFQLKLRKTKILQELQKQIPEITDMTVRVGELR